MKLWRPKNILLSSIFLKKWRLLVAGFVTSTTVKTVKKINRLAEEKKSCKFLTPVLHFFVYLSILGIGSTFLATHNPNSGPHLHYRKWYFKVHISTKTCIILFILISFKVSLPNPSQVESSVELLIIFS